MANINYTPPSLSELLAAYKNNSAGDAINALREGVQGGMGIAAQRQKAQLDQQNKAAELANQQITANAAQATAANGAISAAAQQKEAEAKFVPVEMAEHYAGAAPGTFGAPGTMAPVSSVQDYLNRKSQEGIAASNVQAANIQKEGQRLVEKMRIDAEAKARQAQTDALLRQNQVTQGAGAEEHAATQAPGFWGNLGNMAYKGITLGTQGDLPKVQEYHRLQNTANALLGSNVVNPPRPQSVLGQTTPPPASTVTIKASDGTMHTLPSQSLQAAKQRDPGLQVIQ